jgi:hypothetical protein
MDVVQKFLNHVVPVEVMAGKRERHELIYIPLCFHHKDLTEMMFVEHMGPMCAMMT